MLSAEFHYTEPYIDRWMDLDRFRGHMAYRESLPPISALFASFCGVKLTEPKTMKQTPMKKWDEIETEVTESEFEAFKRQCLLDGIPIFEKIPGQS